jgi:hypothetical protein
MSHALAHPAADLFAAHYLSPHGPQADETIAAQLRAAGLVTVDGLDSRAAVLDFAGRLMRLLPHRDSDPDGLTVIRDTGHRADRSGFAGLGSGALLPHTERSGVPVPPRLMLIVCARPAQAGGEIVLVDGRQVHAGLAAHHPDALAALADGQAAFFGGADGLVAPVFDQIGEGRCSVRLRLDQLVQWHPLARPFVPDLVNALDRLRQPMTLAPGEGYLIDNTRWLHARTAFTGARRHYRALGNPHFAMPSGFIAAHPGWGAVIFSGTPEPGTGIPRPADARTRSPSERADPLSLSTAWSHS